MGVVQAYVVKSLGSNLNGGKSRGLLKEGFMSKTAIIIGAGIGGMATAIRLARDGWSVKVLEKNSRVGGKLDCYSEHGFLWDVGPTLITMPFVLRELFEYAGHELEDYLDLLPIDPVCRYFFPDGKVVNSWSNFHHFQIEVARREKDHGEALENFMRYMQGIYDFAAESYLFGQPKTTLSYLSPRFLRTLVHLPKILTSKKMAEVVEYYFKDPHIRQVFLRYATFHGASPYLASPALNLLAYNELQGGGWYVKGGTYRLAEVLETCARDLGVEFFFDAEVSEITFRSRGSFQKPKATGVLIRGVRMEADVIVCNGDIMHAWTRLLHTKRQAAVSQKWDRKTFSTSPFMILWGVKHRYQSLTHHNVFFSSDYRAEFDDIFRKRKPALEPSIYVGISARTDLTQAPPGQDNYFVMVHAPALEPDHHWEQTRDTYRDVVLDRLERMGLTNLRNEIVCERVITPADFAAKAQAYRGSIYGHAPHSLRDFVNRPSNRCPEVNGLYFVGGSVSPGGGVPLVLLSAQHVVSAIQKDFSSV